MKQSPIRTMEGSGAYKVLSLPCLLVVPLSMPVQPPSLACEEHRNAGVCRQTLSNASVCAAATGDHGTSHLSIVDSRRNAVSFTTTINTSFGSKLFSQSTGIPCQPHMFPMPHQRALLD